MPRFSRLRGSIGRAIPGDIWPLPEAIAKASGYPGIGKTSSISSKHLILRFIWKQLQYGPGLRVDDRSSLPFFSCQIRIHLSVQAFAQEQRFQNSVFELFQARSFMAYIWIPNCYLFAVVCLTPICFCIQTLETSILKEFGKLSSCLIAKTFRYRISRHDRKSHEVTGTRGSCPGRCHSWAGLSWWSHVLSGTLAHFVSVFGGRICGPKIRRQRPVGVIWRDNFTSKSSFWSPSTWSTSTS